MQVDDAADFGLERAADRVQQRRQRADGGAATLLNAVGGTLKPKVRCVINLHNQGAGLPDGGLFTADQFQKGVDLEPLPGQLPGRGAMK